jgi:hypothetical protein
MANGRLADSRVGVAVLGSAAEEAIADAGLKVGGTRGAWEHGFKLLEG